MKSFSSGNGLVPSIASRMLPPSKLNVQNARELEEKRKDLMDRCQLSVYKINYLSALYKYTITCKSILSLDLEDVSTE